MRAFKKEEDPVFSIKEPIKSRYAWFWSDEDYKRLYKFWKNVNARAQWVKTALSKKPLSIKELDAAINEIEIEIKNLRETRFYLADPAEALAYCEYAKKKLEAIKKRVYFERYQQAQNIIEQIPKLDQVIPADERAWIFKMFPHLTEDNIEFELTEASKTLFERGKPDQGYVGWGELDASGKIIVHLMPAYDSVDKIGYRPLEVRPPSGQGEEPNEAPIEPDPASENYAENVKNYKAELARWEAWKPYKNFKEKDSEWLKKWIAWKEDPENFLDKNGERFKMLPKKSPEEPDKYEYVLTGDSYLRGNTGAAHDKGSGYLGIKHKGRIASGLIGFGLYKGERGELLSWFMDRSHSQNSSSIAWHDAFLKDYISSGFEIYGVSNVKTLQDKKLISNIKKPAYVICAENDQHYIINEKNEIYDLKFKANAFSASIKKAEGRAIVKDQFIPCNMFSDLKSMTEALDKLLKTSVGKRMFESGFMAEPPKREPREENIKGWILFDRVRSLPWALSERLLDYLLKVLPKESLPGQLPLKPELAQDKRSKKLTSPLIDAVKNGDLEQVKRWIEGGCSPNEFGCTREEYDDPRVSERGLTARAQSLFEIAQIFDDNKEEHIGILCYLYEHPKFNKFKDCPTILDWAYANRPDLIEEILSFKEKQAEAAREFIQEPAGLGRQSKISSP